MAKLKKKDMKLEPCKICCIVPRVVRLSSADEVPSKARWWYRIECRGFHHVVTLTHKDKAAIVGLWNMLNEVEKEKK